MPLLPDDQAEVRTTALIICGTTLIPAREAAITYIRVISAFGSSKTMKQAAHQGRLGRIARAGEEVHVVGWNDESDDEDGDDIEYQNTEEDTLRRLWNVLTGVACLRGSAGDTFNARVGVGSVGEGCPETEETTK